MTQYATYPSLRDKVVLITGGAEGIGAAAVKLFCLQHSKVVFLDYSDDSATRLLGEINRNAGIAQPKYMKCDVTNLDRLKKCTDTIIAEYGAVDILVNNVGAAGAKSRVPTAKVTPDTFEFDINVNLRHQFFLTQYVVPAMQQKGSGSIVNLGSITWRVPATDVPVYTIAKAAIMGMTRTHSKEFGKYGIRVNSVMPGAIATERQIREVLTDEYRAEVMAAQSIQRDLMPEEVARLILFLASDDSSGITGSSYVCDGGWVSDP